MIEPLIRHDDKNEDGQNGSTSRAETNIITVVEIIVDTRNEACCTNVRGYQ